MEKIDLPQGWLWAPWEQWTNKDGFKRGPFGGALKKEIFVEQGYAVYEQYAPINDNCTQFRYFVTEEKFQEMQGFQVLENDFLISCSGTMGRITLVPKNAPKGIINQALLRVRFIPNTINEYFFLRLFKSPYVQEKILSQSGGGAIQNLASVKELKQTLLPLPSLAEQKEIVRVVESHLKLVDQIKSRLDALPKILEQFRQSVLASAVSGKLTEEWRGELNVFGDIAWEEILKDKKTSFKRGPFGSSLTKSMFVESGYKVYEQYCPINDDCSYVRYFITPEKFEEMKSFEVLDGDFLISCSGSLGKITQVPLGSEKGIINQALLRVRLNNAIYDDDYFKLVFRSPSFQKDIFNNSTGSAIPNLKGVKELKAMRLPFPPLVEQKEIVRRVENLFALADQIETKIKNAQECVNLLTQSILAKAFRGELTAKWREDNPDLISGENSAEALLKRIEAEKKNSKKK